MQPTRVGFGHPFIACIGDDPEQFLDAIASDWRDDPKLCKVGADHIDNRGLLADEQTARAMEHEAARHCHVEVLYFEIRENLETRGQQFQ